MKLGVNIDHIAVLREARGVNDPDIIESLGILRRGGADQVTIHLREDRRHIRDHDAKNVILLSHLPVNIECAIDTSMITIMCELRPERVTLVPEKREERTTEGGLDVIKCHSLITHAIQTLKRASIDVNLFIEPTLEAVEYSKTCGADGVEFHTGLYANYYAHAYEGIHRTPYGISSFPSPKECEKLCRDELQLIRTSAHRAKELGLMVAAGHGLNYANVQAICEIEAIEELNIGQSIIARSVFTGLEHAISDMKKIIKDNQ